jgi:F0F1-type ATP synthase beta subunit
MCPLAAGGTVALAGEFGAGTPVVIEELVRRLAGGTDRISVFAIIQEWPGSREPGFSYAEELKKDGFSEGTVGAVQSFFFRADEGPWTAERLAGLATADVVIHLSREMAKAKIYPCVDVRTSRSWLLESQALSHAHETIARRARQAVALLRHESLATAAGPLAVERARKHYFAQPFFCAEPWTKAAWLLCECKRSNPELRRDPGRRSRQPTGGGFLFHRWHRRDPRSRGPEITRAQRLLSGHTRSFREDDTLRINERGPCFRR